jgi:hypothetical protein
MKIKNLLRQKINSTMKYIHSMRQEGFCRNRAMTPDEIRLLGKLAGKYDEMTVNGMQCLIANPRGS